MAKQERDDITTWIANDEDFYNRVMRLYDRWVDEGDAWDERRAELELARVVVEIAEALSSENSESGEYTMKERREAVSELMSDFEEYRDAEIAERLKQAAAPAVQRKPMSTGDIEYAGQLDKLLARIGVAFLPDVVDHPVNMTAEDSKQAAIEHLLQFMPASKDKIRGALEKGDEYLNTIKLSKWDQKAEAFNYRRLGLSLSEATGLLKHVAKWYYA